MLRGHGTQGELRLHKIQLLLYADLQHKMESQQFTKHFQHVQKISRTNLKGLDYQMD